EDDGNRGGHPLQRQQRQWTAGPDRVGLQADEFGGIFLRACQIAASPTIVDRRFDTLSPAELLQTPRECRDAQSCLRIVLSEPLKHPDPSDALVPLSPPRERQRSRHAAEQRDKIAAL